MISREMIEDIKFRSPVLDVIGSYVNLKKGGSNWKGLCPFHSEKTPSFIVFPDTQDFHCFGCGAGGDVISFIMRAENLEYIDAIQFLAKRCGVVLQEETKNDDRYLSRTRILEMNTQAAKYFRNCLLDENLGAPGREYFEKRHLSKATINHFGLGYAPASFNGLVNHLKKLGYSEEEIIGANLGRRSAKNNKVYDFFNGRVMFPIIDVSGNVIAFGGRVLDNSEPKYLNSSETAAFKKGKNLFALNFARKHCSERLILCEGYMDVIALHQAGFENAVATLGTAITPDQARIFKRYSPACLISYDADAAGQKNADNAFRLLEEAGVDTRIIKVHDAKDPDEFIAKFGKEAFQKVLDSSNSRFSFVYQNITSKVSLENPDQKAKAVHDLCAFIADIPSHVQREIYQKELALKIGLSNEAIDNEVKHILRKKQKADEKKGTSELIRVTSGIQDRVNPDFAKMPKIARLEEMVLGLLLLREEYRKQAVNGSVSEQDFQTAYGKRLFSFILSEEKNGGFEFAVLNSVFSQDEVSRASTILCERKNLNDNGQAVFDESVALLRNESSKISENSSDDFFSILEKKRKNENISNN